MVGSTNKTIVMFPLQLEICDRTIINREICIRWYPDNCQIIPHVSDIEESEKSSALDKFLEKGTELKLLPDYISLYTYENHDGEKLQELVKNIRINPKEDPKNPDYLILHPFTGWINDFDKAVENGMGIRITDPTKCHQLDNAKWLIAVGYKDDIKNDEILRELFVANKALGNLEILRQDTPTNNTENSTSAYSSDIISIPNESANPGIKTDINGGNLLSTALGIDSEIVRDVENSTLIEQRAAIAMSRLLWDACTNEYYHNYMNYAVPEGKGNNPDLDDTYSADMDRYLWPLIRRHFETYVIGRGAVPSLRINNNPYGILPVTSLDGWRSPESDENSYKYKLDSAMAIILSALKEKILNLSVSKWDQSETTGDKQFEHLVQVLQLNPVSNNAIATLNSNKPDLPPNSGKDYYSSPILEPPVNLIEGNFLFCWDEVKDYQLIDDITENDIPENRLVGFLKQIYGTGWGWPNGELKDGELKFEYYSDYIKKNSPMEISVGWIARWKKWENERWEDYEDKEIMAVKLELKSEPLFNWDEIPRNNNENKKLIEFLKKNYCVDWVKEEDIERDIDGKIIISSIGNKYISLKLNDDKSIVNIRVDDGRNIELITKTENDKLSIFYDNKVNLKFYDYWSSQDDQDSCCINTYELVARRENGNKLSIYCNNDKYITINETMKYYTLIANAQYPNTRLSTLEIRERLLNKKVIMPLLQRLLLYSAMVLEDELKSLAEEYLFNWDDIPGKDNSKLIKFLKLGYTPDLANARIDLIDADTIVISTELNRVSLKLNDRKTEVNLEYGSFDRGNLNVKITDKLIAKRESGKLKIYNEGTISQIDFHTINVVSETYQYKKWGQYPLIDLFGEKYVPLCASTVPIWNSHVDKLAKLVIDHDDCYTLRNSENIDLGDGYSLQVKQIDVDGKKVWLELDKDRQYVDDEIISIGPGDDTWTCTLDNIQGVNNASVFKVHVKQVFQGATDSIVQIEGIWLIDYANIMDIKIGDELGEYKIIKIIPGVSASNLGSLVFGK